MIRASYIEFATGEVPDGAWAARFTTSCPRFGRMDALSRLSLMAVESLGVEFENRDEVGVCLETRYGSLGADRQFLRTLSPSVFPYTLPSTTVAEICIRHRLRGPVLCLLTESGDGRQALEHGQAWLKSGEATSCLCLCADASGDHPAEAAAVYLRETAKVICSLRELCINSGRPVQNTTMQALIQELKQKIVLALNLQEVKPEDIKEDEPLFGAGLGLDSIDALELVVMLERDYGIVIQEQVVAQAAFASVRTLATFVSEKRKK